MDLRRIGSRWSLAASAALLCLGVLGGGPPQESGAKPPTPEGAPPGAVRRNPAAPSLLLVTLDTWRWDYLGASGSGRAETPALDKLASAGAYEPEAETPCPLTTPAHATLLTGLLPTRHHVLDCMSYVLPPGLPTLAEAFRDRRYGTAAFVSSQTLGRRFGLSRGFTVYEDRGLDRAPLSYWDTAARDGSRTTEAALRYLRSLPAGSPQFVWVHYYDLHKPYRRRAAYDARHPRDPYASQVAFADAQVASLLEAIRSDASRSWRVLVVGDHGEGLGDHQEPEHGLALYRSTLHVPLILYPKPDRPLLHPKPWRLEDLAPTVRDWFGLPSAAVQDGETLFQPGHADRLLPSMTLQPSIEFSVNPCLGIRQGSFMYIRHAREELYDLASDPGEIRNLSEIPANRRILEALRAACDRSFPRDVLRPLVRPTRTPSAKELDALRGLGYLGGGTPPMDSLQSADIQEVCRDFARFEAVRESQAGGRDPGPLVKAYGEILAKYPRAMPFLKDLGILLLGAGDEAGAFKAFDRAARLNPGDPAVLLNLGSLYLLRGETGKAKTLLEGALSVDDTLAVAHKNLGLLYARNMADPARAASHFRRYLELAPDAPDAADARALLEKLERAPGPGGR